MIVEIEYGKEGDLEKGGCLLEALMSRRSIHRLSCMSVLGLLLSLSVPFG